MIRRLRGLLILSFSIHSSLLRLRTTDYLTQCPSGNETIKKRIVYCRVSTRGQQQHLEHQIACMREHFPDHEVVRDIGSGQDSRGFWNSRCVELSKKLWLHTETELQDSDSNWLTGSYNDVAHDSWFSIQRLEVSKRNSSTTSSHLCTYSRPSRMDQARKEEEEETKDAN